MDRNGKNVELGELRDRFGKMTAAVFVDFKGMTVENVTKLRAEFRKAGVDYRVVKNTLVKHALKDAPYKSALAGALVGMTGIAWSYEDPSAAPRAGRGSARIPAGTSSRSRPASSTARSSTARASRTSWQRCRARTSSAPRFWRRSKRLSRTS